MSRSKASKPASERGKSFDEEYYRRFYDDSETRVSDLAEIRRLGTFVAGYLAYLQVPVRSVLDFGCGVGHWQKVSEKLWPRARYYGVEYSEHLCERFGWQQGSITDFDAKARLGRDSFDLVVCQGVLQYLDDRSARRALQNLCDWSDGALYLEALTKRDWEENCDRSVTDGDVHLRPASFYRRHLKEHFQDCGGGVFCSRHAGVSLFELEGS